MRTLCWVPVYLPLWGSTFSVSITRGTGLRRVAERAMAMRPDRHIVLYKAVLVCRPSEPSAWYRRQDEPGIMHVAILVPVRYSHHVRNET